MTLEVTILLIVVIAALAAFAGFWLAGKKDGGDLPGILDKISQEQAALGVRLTELSDVGRKSQTELAKTVGDRLDKVSQSMGKSLEESSTKTAKSIGEIQTRLKAFTEMSTELSGEISDLQGILSNKQERGAFGEQQLNDLVTNTLPPNAYDFQVTLSNGKRADCLILLPNPPGPIVVDAKFPLESYRALQAAETDEEKKVAARDFSTALLHHVKAIEEKYIIEGETAESALMFLPSEAVYAELHAGFPKVVEKSQKARVWIVSPTTLMATLITIRSVLKDVKMREQAGLIQKEVGALLGDVVRLDKRVDDLAKHFGLAEKDIRMIQTSTGKITRRTERISDVQLEDSASVEGAVEEALEAPSADPQSGPRLVTD
jgi:DNA recombination protein RmuC